MVLVQRDFSKSPTDTFIKDKIHQIIGSHSGMVWPIHVSIAIGSPMAPSFSNSLNFLSHVSLKEAKD